MIIVTIREVWFWVFWYLVCMIGGGFLIAVGYAFSGLFVWFCALCFAFVTLREQHKQNLENERWQR